MVKVRPFRNINIYAKCYRGKSTGNPSLGWYLCSINNIYEVRRERERDTFFFLIEKDIVIQCYLTAQLMLSEGGESSPCPICQSLEYEKSRHTVPLIRAFKTAGVHFHHQSLQSVNEILTIKVPVFSGKLR